MISIMSNVILKTKWVLGSSTRGRDGFPQGNSLLELDRGKDNLSFSLDTIRQSHPSYFCAKKSLYFLRQFEKLGTKKRNEHV
jgi:hypothetical protein